MSRRKDVIQSSECGDVEIPSICREQRVNGWRAVKCHRKTTTARVRHEISKNEAGHAVLFYLLRQRLQHVTIVPQEDNLGRAIPMDALAMVSEYNAGVLRRRKAEPRLSTN
jgi:hypothetical protein